MVRLYRSDDGIDGAPLKRAHGRGPGAVDMAKLRVPLVEVQHPSVLEPERHPAVLHFSDLGRLAVHEPQAHVVPRPADAVATAKLHGIRLVDIDPTRARREPVRLPGDGAAVLAEQVHGPRRMVRAALRRHEVPEPFTLGALAIDYDRRRVTVGGDPITLTATEFELLRVLALNAGRVMTYDTLLRRVWEGRDGADANLVRIFVRNLRRKLGDDAASPAYIFNERGVGYRMAGPGEE